MAVEVDLAWRRAVNVSGTAIRASREHPVLVEGFQYTLTTGSTSEVWFFITNVMDHAALPGFEKGTDPEDDAQALFHEGGKREFELGRNDCG